MVEIEQENSIFESKTFGKNFKGTQFNDLDDKLSSLSNINIHEMIFYDDGGFLCGVKVIYRLEENKNFTNGAHCVCDVDNIDKSKWQTNKNKTIISKSLIFKNDEYITKLIVRSGDIIDGLEIETNKGNKLAAGGLGGGKTEFIFNDRRFVGFSGSHEPYGSKGWWCTIHQLTVHFSKI